MTKEKRYGFRISGKDDPVVYDWCENQVNLTASIKVLIQQAVAMFGSDDLMKILLAKSQELYRMPQGSGQAPQSSSVEVVSSPEPTTFVEQSMHTVEAVTTPSKSVASSEADSDQDDPLAILNRSL